MHAERRIHISACAVLIQETVSPSWPIELTSPPITIMTHIYGATLATAGLHADAMTANIDYV